MEELLDNAATEPLVVVEELPATAPKQAVVEESFLPIQDLRLAAALCVFRSMLSAKCPLEWIDEYESRESFILNKTDPQQCQPKAQLTWNFSSFPRPRVVEAFYKPMETLDAELESLLNGVEPLLRVRIREAFARLIMRCCHETLLQREALAAYARKFPENRKFDQIKSGRRIVRLGKRASSELRQRYLSKLPP
jgi:hypothetical protein